MDQRASRIYHQGIKNNYILSVPKTVVIGASGFLGGNFLLSHRYIHPSCIGTTRKADNTRNIASLDLLSPNIIPVKLAETGHTDALILTGITKIERCEREKELSKKVNVHGTLELIRQLVSEGIKPIYFSSDYVFDGKTGGYTDDASTNPITEYGRQKAEVEAKIGEISEGNYLVVRLSKIFSLQRDDNSLLDEMANILASKGRVKAAYDQVFCPTLISDVIDAVGCLQAKGVVGVVNVCSPEAWSRYEIAIELAKAMRIDTNSIFRISLEEMRFDSRRPKNTSMIAKRLSTETQIKFSPILECIRLVANNWD